MYLYTKEQLENFVKVVGDKNVRWAQARSYGTIGNVPAGWTVKKEPFELAMFVKDIIKENEELKLKIKILEENKVNKGIEHE